MIKLIPVFTVLQVSYAEKGCEISIDYQNGDLKEPQPLILNGSYQFRYPDDEARVLQFSTGQSILLACAGKQNTFDEPLKSDQIIRATCLNEICRDDKTDETYYAKLEMSKSVSAFQHGIPRPDWDTQNLFMNDNLKHLYTKKSQKQVFERILNSEKLVKKYLDKNSLTQGHLAPKADFVYGSEQNTTFSYANAAPQWTTFNDGNWLYVETAVRKFVVDNDLKVTIYTGVHGQMKLRDENNNEHPVFLDIDENNNGYIRVPQFYWKIVYDPVHYLAVGVVGVNDPFRDEITKDMYLCPDISDSPIAAWLTESWSDRMTIWMGVSYVCSFEELKKAVPTVPDLKVKGILRSYRE